MRILILLSLIPLATHADSVKTRMKVCSNDSCKEFLKSSQAFKRKYCKDRRTCAKSVDKVVFNTMKESNFPMKADHSFWSKYVKEGEIHVPASKRSDF